MDIFEFVLVMVSLVLAIGLTGLLREVSAMISDRKTKHFDWVRITWIAILFLYVISYWWSMWDYREVEWTFPGYAFLLLVPTLLYIAMDLLVRCGASMGATTPEEAFEGIRVPFFVTMFVVQLFGTWDDWLLSVAPVWTSLRWLQIAMILLFAVGIFVSRRVAQQVIALTALFVLAFGMFGLRYLPGPLGSG